MSFLSARISAFMTLTEELAEVPVVVEEDDAGVVLPVLLAVFVDPEELPLEDAPAEVVVLPDDEEEVEDVPDAVVDGVPTVSVGTLVPEEEPVEAAKVFPGTRTPIRTVATPALPSAIEMDFLDFLRMINLLF